MIVNWKAWAIWKLGLKVRDEILNRRAGNVISIELDDVIESNRSRVVEKSPDMSALLV